MSKLLAFCRVLYKVLGYVIAAGSGAYVASNCSGCAFVPVM